MFEIFLWFKQKQDRLPDSSSVIAMKGDNILIIKTILPIRTKAAQIMVCHSLSGYPEKSLSNY